MEGGAWYEEYDDDDFMENYEEAIEVPEQQRKKTKLIDPNDPDQPEQPKLKKPVQNPRPKLDVERLMSEEKGLPELLKMASNITFNEGREIKDMRRALVMYKIWSHRLFPKYTFEDFLMKCETLGKKRPVKTHLKKVRIGMIPM